MLIPKNVSSIFNFKPNNYIIMKKVLFVLALFMAGLVVNSQAGKTDFSGTWNLNAEKSKIS